jgi:hypothetical protein
VRKGGPFFNRRIEDIAPINSYAQYIVKYTVAMVPQTVMVASDQEILPKRNEFDTSSAVVPKKSWWASLTQLIAMPGLIAIGVVALFALAFLLPGVRGLVNSIFRLFAALIDRLTDRIKPKP